MKKLLILLFVLLWTLLLVVKDAGSTNIPQNDYSSPYISAINSPSWPEFPPKWTWHSCVEFAKWYTGHQGETWGWAGNLKPILDSPKVGSIVITDEGGGHIGVVTSVSSHSFEIIEANYISGQVSTRSLDFRDSRIRGFR